MSTENRGDDEFYSGDDINDLQRKPDVAGDWVWYSICLCLMFLLVVSCVYITWQQMSG